MRKRVPGFFGLRIYAFSAVLYYFLVMPFLLILTIKYSPKLRELGEFRSDNGTSISIRLGNSPGGTNVRVRPVTDSLGMPTDSLYPAGISDSLPVIDTIKGKEPTPPKPAITNTESQIGKAFSLLFNLLIISFVFGFVFNLPFKRYFYKKRKRKEITEKLHRFCRKYLLHVPLINAGILSLAFGITHGYMLYVLNLGNGFGDGLEKTLYVQFFWVSLLSSLLSVMFVFFWEKHRVHIRYIEHLYDENELQSRIFGKKTGKIRNGLLISSAMTTLLPLTIVMLYLFLSVTYLSELPDLNFSDEQKKILLGDYLIFSDGSLNTKFESIPGWLFYFNVVNSLLMIIGIYSGIMVAFLYIVFFVKWTTQDIVIPVSELLENIKNTGAGEINNFSIVRTNDEIGELTEGYNEMTRRIRDYVSNISQMTEAYSRFVPRQFLDFLGKNAFTDIKLGDQVQKEMTVLFTDIRSFTEISEHMTPKENFDFINYYLGYMEPVIRNNNGFIDKYIGDSIMALFGEYAEDAINAAIEMRIKLSQFNQVMSQFGKPTINSGIGIHTGSLMLGVVGGEGRMDGTVISDAVNLANRLEGLTKLYGSSIIISQDTLIRLNNPGLYNYRFLDLARVKGKKKSVYIFEILDGEPDDIRHLKMITKDLFAQGINHYNSKEFARAMQLFEEVYKTNNQDLAARLYIERCSDFIKFGVPEDWDGIDTYKDYGTRKTD
ncbi:MAG: hypothetical protein JXA03_07725 [Bacteroidales bacterium]|nr:hypothetical protein [Bacteroidales bacterium]